MNELEITRFPQLDYAASEALNTLCTNLTFSGKNVKVIMVTSCDVGEGKSYIAANIVKTMASLGKNVLLIDADLRRSKVAVSLGFRFLSRRAFGLTHYLAGMCEIDDVVYKTNIDGEFIVPVGQDVVNSLSLLNTPRLQSLFEELGEQMDYVIVDAPPIGVIIDAAEIAKFCDATLFVVSYNRIRRKELASAKALIERTGCRVLGAVLNSVEMDSYASRRYYSKTYYKQYANPDENASRKKKQDKKNHREASS